MKMMTCREASEVLAEYGMTASRLKRECLNDQLPCMRVGNRVMVDVDVLRVILEKRREQDDLLSTGELSVRIGLSESTIRRAVRDGWLPCRMIGRNMRFSLTEVENAIAEQMGRKYDT